MPLSLLHANLRAAQHQAETRHSFLSTPLYALFSVVTDALHIAADGGGRLEAVFGAILGHSIAGLFHVAGAIHWPARGALGRDLVLRAVCRLSGAVLHRGWPAAQGLLSRQPGQSRRAGRRAVACATCMGAPHADHAGAGAARQLPTPVALVLVAPGHVAIQQRAPPPHHSRLHWRPGTARQMP